MREAERREQEALNYAKNVQSESNNLKARLNKKKFTTEQDLAAQMLMARIKRSEKLDKFTYVIQ